MKKQVALDGLLACGFVFLLIQVSFLCRYNENSVPRFKEVNSNTNVNKKHASVQLFLQVCMSFNVDVFLIDPTPLCPLARSNGTMSRCNFPSDRNVITFGGLGSRWIDHPILIKTFEDRQFTVIRFMDRDPRLFSLTSDYNVTIPTHYIFEHNGQIIHVVLFYERGAKHLWHSALSGFHKAKRRLIKSGVGSVGRHIVLGQSAALVDRVNTVLVEADGLLLRVPKYSTRFLSQLRQNCFIECEYGRAKQFYKDYPVTNTGSSGEFRVKANKLLQLGKKLLDSLGIPFWLSSGTLLGWFRQCDFIPHSKDVDFGIFIKHYSADLISTFMQHNMALKHVFGRVSDSYELSFQYEDLKLDIFFFYEEEDYMWNGGTQASTGNKYKYFFPKFTMCWTEFLGIHVQVPCETLSYIEANYGKDWYRPVTSWDWKASPPNVRRNGQWTEEEMDETVQLYET